MTAFQQGGLQINKYVLKHVFECIRKYIEKIGISKTNAENLDLS